MVDRGNDQRGAEVGDSFVIWLDTRRPGEPQRGTVEHVGSATRERFEDLSELPQVIERTLASLPQPPR